MASTKEEYDILGEVMKEKENEISYSKHHLLDMKDLKSAYHHLTMEFKLSLKRIPSLEKEVVQLKSERENAQHHGHVVYEADDMGLTNVEHEDVEPRHVSN